MREVPRPPPSEWARKSRAARRTLSPQKAAPCCFVARVPPEGNLGQKAKLNRILAEVCETLDGRCDTDTLCTQLKLQCAEAVYKHNIALAGRDFIAGDDPYP